MVDGMENQWGGHLMSESSWKERIKKNTSQNLRIYHWIRTQILKVESKNFSQSN